MSRSDFLDPYDHLINITILGRKAEVPNNNTLLRCFQYLCPETVAYGRFCWNNECGNSRFEYKLNGTDQPKKARACITEAIDGMLITDLSGELRYALRDFLRESEPDPDPTADDQPPPIVFRNEKT